MRRWMACVAVGALLAMTAAGCSGEPGLMLEPLNPTARVGETVGFTVLWNGGGVSGCMAGDQDVTGAAVWHVDGKQVPGPPMVFDKPGVYSVRAGAKGLSASTSVTVTGEAAAGGETTGAPDVSLSVDTAPEADPASLEIVFEVNSLMGVQNGGTPPSFTISRARRIRQILTYHYNDGKGTSGGGTVTLEAADGRTYGPFKANRTSAGQGNVPNAYWYADVDFELPAGTYRLVDSDPSTWSQNSETRGVGIVVVRAER